MIAVINVVTVPEGNASDFEAAFSNRERLLDRAEGFAGFELLRRGLDGGQVEFLVVSRWRDEEAFHGWARSDLFKKVHARDGRRDLGSHSEVCRYDVLDVEEVRS
jgi:heme-degrading monooxygenase HmoA